MRDLFWFFYVFIIFYIIVFSIRYIIIFRRLISLPLRYPVYKIKESHEFPDYIKKCLEPIIEKLKNLDFSLEKYIFLEGFGIEQYWKILMYNKQTKTFALLYMPSNSGYGNTVNIDWYNSFKDGSWLLTFNGRESAIIFDLPATIVHDPFKLTLEEEWIAHCEKLKELEFQNANNSKNISTSEFLELLESYDYSVLSQAIVARKVLHKNNSYHYTFKETAKITFKLIKYVTSLNKLITQRIKNNPNSIEVNNHIPPEAEVNNYKTIKKYEKLPTRKDVKIFFFVSTFILFLISGSIVFDFILTITLILVLLLHEFGHFFAMKYYNYENKSIFFLPFLGAAAAGTKDKATVKEQVFVLLAGPVPGILLGCLLGILLRLIQQRIWTLNDITVLSISSNPFKDIAALAIILVVLNYLNLLPILPFDGGKIANLLIFSIHPYSEILFKLFTSLFLIFSAIFLQNIFIFLIGIAPLATIMNSWHSAKILQQLKKDNAEKKLREKSDDEILLYIFQIFPEVFKKPMGFNNKYNLVKNALLKYHQPSISLKNRLVLIFLYLTCLIGGLIIIGITVFTIRSL